MNTLAIRRPFARLSRIAGVIAEKGIVCPVGFALRLKELQQGRVPVFSYV